MTSWLLLLALLQSDGDLLLVPEARALTESAAPALEQQRLYLLETLDLSLEAVRLAERRGLVPPAKARALAALIEPIRTTFSSPLPDEIPPLARTPAERYLAGRALALLPAKLYDRSAVEGWNEAARRFLAGGGKKEFERLAAAFRRASRSMVPGGKLLSFLFRLRRGALSADELAAWRLSLAELDPWIALAVGRGAKQATPSAAGPALPPAASIGTGPKLDGVDASTREVRTVQEWLNQLRRGAQPGDR